MLKFLFKLYVFGIAVSVFPSLISRDGRKSVILVGPSDTSCHSPSSYIYAILTWRSEFDDIWRRDGDGEMVMVRWWWWNQMASSPCIWFNTCFVHQASLTNPLVHLLPGYRFKAKSTTWVRTCLALAGQGDASPPPLHLGSDHTHQVGIREEGKVSDSGKLWIQCETNMSPYIIPYLYEKPRCLQSTTYLGTSTRLPRTTLAQCLTG